MMPPKVKRPPTSPFHGRVLSTNERYAPTPPRPIIRSPVVNVKRHSNSTRQTPETTSRQSLTGPRRNSKSASPKRKKAKVLLITDTPLTKDTQNIKLLPNPSNLTTDSVQTNNSSAVSYYSMLSSPAFSVDRTYQPDFVDDSYSYSWNPSMTFTSPEGNSFKLASNKFALTEPHQKTIRRLSNARRNSLSPSNLRYDRTPTRNVKSPQKNRSPRSSSASEFSQTRDVSLINSSPKSNQSFRGIQTNQAISNTSHTISVSRGSTDRNATSNMFSSRPSAVQFLQKNKRGSILTSRSLINHPKTSTKKSVARDSINSHIKEKGVKFGPTLSPEQFDYRLPPSTPLKRGAVPRSSITSNIILSAGTPRDSIVPKKINIYKTPRSAMKSTQPARTHENSPKRSLSVPHQSARVSTADRSNKSFSSPNLSGVKDMLKTPLRTSVSTKRKSMTSEFSISRSRTSESPVRPSPAKVIRQSNSTIQSVNLLHFKSLHLSGAKRPKKTRVRNSAPARSTRVSHLTRESPVGMHSTNHISRNSKLP